MIRFADEPGPPENASEGNAAAPLFTNQSHYDIPRKSHDGSGDRGRGLRDRLRLHFPKQPPAPIGRSCEINQNLRYRVMAFLKFRINLLIFRISLNLGKIKI